MCLCDWFTREAGSSCNLGTRALGSRATRNVHFLLRVLFSLLVLFSFLDDKITFYFLVCIPWGLSFPSCKVRVLTKRIQLLSTQNPRFPSFISVSRGWFSACCFHPLLRLLIVLMRFVDTEASTPSVKSQNCHAYSLNPHFEEATP